jgi:hypothetical protein
MNGCHSKGVKYLLPKSNIFLLDAFLHQVHSAITKLKYLVDRVNDVINVKVEGTIQQISEMIFFDYELAFSKSWVRDLSLTIVLVLVCEMFNSIAEDYFIFMV